MAGVRSPKISKSLMRYHPRIGYTYMPSTKLRVQGANGGYLVRTNAAGFRSEREFVRERSPGTFRTLLFGDSQTAGDGTGNASRFSDLLEKSVPGLEVYNYALSGTGTDQQYLTYGEVGPVEHDLVVIGLFVENIRRLTPRVLRTRDITGEDVYRAKPYYELVQDGLALRNVPVPKQPWTLETLPAELLPHVYSYGNEYSFFRDPNQKHASLLRRLAPAGLRAMATSLMARLRTFQPLPEYNSARAPEWQLLREILAMWVSESSVPVLLVALPHDSGLRGKSDPRNYQARFRELAKDTGCQVYDPLPELLELSDADRHELWSYTYGHLSVQGHAAIARLLAPVLHRIMAGRLDTAHRA